MAQLVISAAGAVIGNVLLPGIGGQLGWLAGSLLGAAIAPPQRQVGSILSDLKITGTEYGQPIPWIAGHPRVAGQIWWASDRRPIANTTSVGKGPGGSGESTTYTYDVDVLIGLSDNEIDGVGRVWDNGKLVYNATSSATSGTVDASATADLWARMTVYTGAADQLPDPTYEAAVGTANAPAYRGRGYVFIESLHLGVSGAMRNLTFEIGKGQIVRVGAWTINNAATSSDWDGIAYGGGPWAAVSNDYAAPNSVMMFSTNGAGWSSKGIYSSNGVDPPTLMGGDLFMSFKSVAFGNGIFVAAATSYIDNRGAHDPDWPNVGYPIAFSGDGARWIIALADDAILITDGRLANCAYGVAIAFGGGVFVVVFAHGIGNRLMSSTNGRDWGLGSSAGDYAWTSIDYGNGKFVALAPSFAMTSTDGGAWTLHATPSASACLGVAWGEPTPGNGLWVAVGGGDIMTSPDGENWTLGAAQAGCDLRSIAYGAGMWVAVSRTGTNRIRTSTDGIIWTAAAAPGAGENREWFSVAFGYDDYGHPMFVAVAHAYTTGGDSQVMRLVLSDIPLITLSEPTVAETVSALCLRAGLSAGQFDVTALSTITRKVRALSVSQVAATRSTLELLMSTYFFDVGQSDKIYFVPRGGAAVASIPYADLGASRGAEPPEPLALQQSNDLEQPAQVALSYINVDNDYQTDTQYSDRLISATPGTVSTMQIALGMTASEAKAVANTLLLDQVVGGVGSKIALLGDYSRLEATDPVNVTGPDGTTFRMRLTKRNDAYPLLEFDAVMDDVSVLTSAGITSGGGSGGTTIVPAPVNTIMELLDIPILRDVDDDPGFYVAAKGDASPWPGAVIYSSSDDVQYTEKATITASAVFGSCTTALGDWTGPRQFDERNNVTVDVGAGALASSTVDVLLFSAGTNAMLVGAEIIQFRTATLISTGVYTLSGLLRGCRGTEWAMSGHVAGERCVLLTDALRRIPMQTTELGHSLYYKAVTLGRALSTAPITPPSPTGLPGDATFSSSDMASGHAYPTTPVTASGDAGFALRFVADNVGFPNGVTLSVFDQSSALLPKDAVISISPHDYSPVGANPAASKTGIGVQGDFLLRFGLPVGISAQPYDVVLTAGATYYLNFRATTTPRVVDVVAQFLAAAR